MPTGGGRYPIGWTYSRSYGETVRYAWVTAEGRGTDRVGVPTRPDAEAIVRDWHATGRGAPGDTRLADGISSLPADRLASVSATLRMDDEETLGAPVRCVHGFTERPGDPTVPAAVCAAKASAVSVGVFSDEGCVDYDDCAVAASEITDRHNREDEAAREAAAAGEPLYRWAVMCSDHEEQPTDACQECIPGGGGEEGGDGPDDGGGRGGDGPGAPVTFTEGDRIVCADGAARTVRAMAPLVGGEPARVITGDGTEWIAENCRRANWGDVGEAWAATSEVSSRVAMDPDPADPEWRAALKELGVLLGFLKAADPIARGVLAEEGAKAAARAVHPGAHDFQAVARSGDCAVIGWSFRAGHGHRARYGVVTAAEVLSPVGLYEYRTTAERAHLHGGIAPADS